MSASIKRLLRHSLLPFGLVAIFVVLIMVAVGFSLKSIVHSTLEKEAERKAELWAEDFLAQTSA